MTIEKNVPQVCRDEHTYSWKNQHIPMGAWYGKDEIGCWFCTAHAKSEDGSLELYRFNGVRWVKAREKSATTLTICAWANKNGLWWTKCQWFKEEDAKKRLVARQYAHNQRYENLMKHSRR